MGVELVSAGDTLHDVALRHRLGYLELVIANPGIDPWVPPPGTPVRLPSAHILPDAPRDGIVVNLADQRLYRFRPDGTAESMAIGVGALATATPQGEARVVRKQKNPTWYPPASIRAEKPAVPAAVPPGPENPLGEHALYLNWPAYLIHGTNKPLSIGRLLTHGCVRLYPQDIASLHATVPVGTPVRVVDQPVKVGWAGGRLYLEVHPTLVQAEAIETGKPVPAAIPQDLVERIAVARERGDRNVDIDWTLVHRVAAEHTGIPVAIDR